jgi:hypothetical protein
MSFLNNEWISYEVHKKALKLETYVSFNLGPYIDFVFFCSIPSASPIVGIERNNIE